MRVPLCVCVFRIVSMDKILHVTNTLIIIIILIITHHYMIVVYNISLLVMSALFWHF